MERELREKVAKKCRCAFVLCVLLYYSKRKGYDLKKVVRNFRCKKLEKIVKFRQRTKKGHQNVFFSAKCCSLFMQFIH